MPPIGRDRSPPLLLVSLLLVDDDDRAAEKHSVLRGDAAISGRSTVACTPLQEAAAPPLPLALALLLMPWPGRSGSVTRSCFVRPCSPPFRGA